ncbi:hypothetical protein C8Q70DRAFT_39627 [Cubamyces menziesii]|nr:hypothetical protein C8Q70DRAFT_39627 [Cubamyces menziesii]
MVPIVSQESRPAHKLNSTRSTPKASSQPCDPADDPFYFVPDARSPKSPQQLLPPFRLPEEAGRSKVSSLYARSDPPMLTDAQLSKPAPCSPTKRRRGLSSNLSRSVRRRHTPRSECCINNFPRPITSFDELPWISALTIEPDLTDPWDIADLSLLKADWQEMSSGPGPMRRRKTSLRSDPLSQPSPHTREPPSPIPFPFIQRDGFPQTPAPRFYSDPSEVVFQGLYPMFPSDVDTVSGTEDIEASL